MNWTIVILLAIVVVACIYMTKGGKTKESYEHAGVEDEKYDVSLLPDSHVRERELSNDLNDLTDVESLGEEGFDDYAHTGAYTDIGGADANTGIIEEPILPEDGEGQVYGSEIVRAKPSGKYRGIGIDYYSQIPN